MHPSRRSYIRVAHVCALNRPTRGAMALVVLTAAVFAGCDRSNPPPPAELTDASAAKPPEKTSRKVFESGLTIEDLSDGSGPECPRDATVEVDFTGLLEDGRVFDSSAMRRTRLTLPLSRPSTIEGLREGIPGMRVGGKRRIIIPWPMGYGEQGRDPIPPMANLTFEITLLKIVQTADEQSK